ncbi:prepilin-type N-terminal cleavage/methylation domain-containing protein [Butyricicoccus sp. AF22-28AC]|nr:MULTISPECIES: prepilin-type N-terminal cleavage/methylation domain-containing protein [unclassified Butyricicoccus]RGM77597.1 prepilin-type N-terminal cleavage/methylation domain-containing protein [Butyricicoccus sp. OM06-6AC]RHQ71040.1 prepilin-type N-terminal cleavage/methylation domain-containing protein [Butyricicoccus sp. AF24-19AC]RHQ81481.1 prepilin-type N-terminal cleavage/methylation domain-containing protein [Butyricicoccus sp. AF22-28AC]RHR85043.1 prepilin-type N-terminal cleavag
MLYSKNKKRGFTLVELIVVLVILAILAALLIPALTGYIDKAKKDQVIAETRMLHEAVQTEMSELYGSANWKLNSATTLANNTGKVIGNNPNGYDLKANYDKIAKLSEVPCLQEGGSGHFLVLINSKAQIHAIIYHSDRGYLGLYFSDTNQYSAYKIGETAEGGKISDNMFRSYYSSVYYNTSVDAVPDSNGNYKDNSCYLWSCTGIRGMLHISELVLPSS